MASVVSRTPMHWVKRGLLYLGLAVMAAALLLPFFWMFTSSFKRNNEIFTSPITWFPQEWQWHNYVDIWAKSDMLTWIGNTLIIAVSVTVLEILSATFVAYGFSRIKFPGRDALFMLYLATIAVPWQSYMIPQFKMLSAWGLSDSRLALILMQSFSAFGVFLMKQFYDTIPEELSEAARIDGLSEYGIYARIMLPLSLPSIASLGIIMFTNAWNDYMGPLIYLRSPDLWTIQIGLKTFVGEFTTDYAIIMTGSVLSVLPILLIFIFGQRYFVEGIASTGVKG